MKLFSINVDIEVDKEKQEEFFIVHIKCHPHISDNDYYEKKYRVILEKNEQINPTIWPTLQKTIKDMLDTAYEFEPKKLEDISIVEIPVT